MCPSTLNCLGMSSCGGINKVNGMIHGMVLESPTLQPSVGAPFVRMNLGSRLGSKVAASLVGTTSMKTLSVPLSTPPSTHAVPSLQRPLLYFLFPNLASSMHFHHCTGATYFLTVFSHENSTKLAAKVAPIYYCTFGGYVHPLFCDRSFVHRYVNSRICSMLRWLREKPRIHTNGFGPSAMWTAPSIVHSSV